MLDLAKAADVPIDAHVLGRVGKDHLRGLAIERSPAWSNRHKLTIARSS
jgi:hypothetical protein